MTELTPAAQNAFAAISDYVRDCMDCMDLMSQKEILEIGDGLDEMITKLTGSGFCLYAAYGNSGSKALTPTQPRSTAALLTCSRQLQRTIISRSRWR